jgi:glycosyltransferase involved in cell wall biosynthesis
MKILFISNLYPPNTVGGYERLCHEMAGALASRGHPISVLTSSYGGRAESYPGQTVHRSLRLLAPEDNIYADFACPQDELVRINARNIERFHETLAAEPPDAVFAWNLKFFDRSLLDAIQDVAVPVFYLLTDIWLISFLDAGFVGGYFSTHVHGGAPHPGILRNLARRALAAIGRRPRYRLRGHAVFASRYMRWLHRRAGLRFDRTAVIHHGVQLAGHAESDYADRALLRSPPELRLLCAGRLVDLKGMHTAIEALPRVIEALPEHRVRLTVLGDARDRPYVERLHQSVREKGLSAHVEFAPAVSEGELFALFQRHDLYLFPSLYEPFSLTLIHALDGGIPTIASDAGGNPEIVRHRRTGLVFPKGDAAQLAQAIATLARDARLRGNIARAGRRAARRYSFDRMVGRVERYITAHL